MSSTAHMIARALGGEIAGRSRVIAPGPGHSAADRSLSVTLDPAAPQGFRVHSFAGDPWQNCRDHVRERLGLGNWTRQEESSPATSMSARPLVGVSDRSANNDDAGILRRKARASEIWREALPITGTLANSYLAGRGLRYDGDALRWHPACPFGKQRLGCMVALVRNIATNEPQAIHRTAISTTAERIDRLSLGPIAGGAVKLADDSDVTLALGLGEGIETTLSLAALVGLPVWATVTAGNLAAFPVLPGIESLWIAVDNDASGTGERAALALVERQEAAGIETITATPDAVGDDLNDRVHRHAQ